MNTGDIMNRNVITVSPECTLAAASELMAHHRVGALAVVERDGTVLGILTASDVVCAHARELPLAAAETAGPEPREAVSQEAATYWYHLGLAEARRRLCEHAEPGGPEVLVSDVYSPGAITVTAGTPASEAARLMSHHRVHHLLVVEDGRLAGILSSLDLVRNEAAAQRAAALAHRESR